MARRTNPDISPLWYAAAAIGVFLIARRAMQGAATVGGYLNPATVDGVPDIPFDPQVIFAKNPRFATETMADRAYAIRRLGGRVVDPRAYPYTLAGFQQFLDASGVNRTWSSAWELAKINHPDIGAKYGYTLFLPPQVWWPKGAALALLQNRLRELVGEPIVISNWWRPKGYNEDPGVGGAPQGDHPDGDALDLFLKSQRSKWIACDWAYKLQQSEPSLAVSLGVYGSSGTLHVGLQSANGKRTWDYRQPKAARARITQSVIDQELNRLGVA